MKIETVNRMFIRTLSCRKIVGGVLGIVFLLAVGLICGCGDVADDDEEMPTQEEIVEFCRCKLIEQYDEASLKKFELSGFSVDEDGTVTVKAEVRIDGKSFAVDPGRSWNSVRATAVFTLRDIGEGDGLHIVDFGYE